MDLDTVTRASFDAVAAHPTIASFTIGGTLIAGAVALWRLADPSRAHRRELAKREVAAAGTNPRERRSTNAMSLRSKNRGPAPGTYVSLTEPPVDVDGRTAYEQLGIEAIRTATDRFYSSVQRDPKLAPFFPADRMDQLKRHLPLLVGQLLGGPVQYHNPAAALRESHQKLRITPATYSFLIAHLNTVLYELGVPQPIRIFLAGQLIMVEDLIIAEALQP
jgi:truncated hemoglobin YjbI